MQTQYTEEKEELLGELRAKTTTTTVKEFAPAGVKLEFNLQGEFKGKWQATHVETVAAINKPDGSGDYEGRAIQTTIDGDILLLTIKGKARQENASTIRLAGETKVQTASQKLAWLNTAKARHEGTYNPLTGEVSVKGYAKT